MHLFSHSLPANLLLSSLSICIKLEVNVSTASAADMDSPIFTQIAWQGIPIPTAYIRIQNSIIIPKWER